MDIPIDVEVHCTDGICGRSTSLLINPVRKEVTHVVVKETEFPYIERLVPIEVVSNTSIDVILLKKSGQELHKMEPFVETEYIKEDFVKPEYSAVMSGNSGGGGGYWMWPYSRQEDTMVPVVHQMIPLGELAIRRGTVVEATDGRVGHVDELLIDPKNSHYTHLVMREGHLWGQKDVVIPVSQIKRTEEATVYLKLSKKEIADLPDIPVHRWWD